MASFQSIIPTFIYKDAPQAIDWLCDCFGFTKHLIHENDSGGITHAQLIFNDCLIMLKSKSDGPFDELVAIPSEINNINTIVPSIVVENIDAHYENVIAKGAEILIPLKKESFGGSGYTCRDPEGYIWYFGTYTPE